MGKIGYKMSIDTIHFKKWVSFLLNPSLQPSNCILLGLKKENRTPALFPFSLSLSDEDRIRIIGIIQASRVKFNLRRNKTRQVLSWDLGPEAPKELTAPPPLVEGLGWGIQIIHMLLSLQVRLNRKNSFNNMRIKRGLS